MKTKIKELDFYKDMAEIFERYREQEMAVFLDSSLNCSMGKYSVIGLHPYLIVKEVDGVTYENEMAVEESFEYAVKKHCLNYYEANDTGLPFIAGAIGYLSYDYGRKFEKIKTRHSKKIQVPEALFAFYDLLIIEDKEKKRLYITARGELENPCSAMERVEREIQETHSVLLPDKHDMQNPFMADFEKNDYMKTVRKMVSYIVEGDIYIANMTQQLRAESSMKPYDVYRYLRRHNPSPFGGYFNYGRFQILCASPERFIRIRDGRIETRPIKGTRKRGKTEAEDEKLEQKLRDSEKEQSELLMIVDLERNDLSRVCVPGSVRVPELFAIEKYATVFHMVSTVEGKLKENIHAMDVIPEVFPGGSITGAPKIRAMEIIDELEHDRRGIYTGCIGYLSFDGSCDLNIVIRTAIHQNGTYHLGVGGGITCESEPEFEYEETLQKAKAVLEAMAEVCDIAGE